MFAAIRRASSLVSSLAADPIGLYPRKRRPIWEEGNGALRQPALTPPISEVCQEVAGLSDPLPETLLTVLYRETKVGDDLPMLKMDETYRGAGRYVLRLVERRKDGIRRRKALKS